MKLFPNTFKGLLIHLLIIGSLGVALVLCFFYIYLPSTTNHGETITVPDLIGEHFDKMDERLTERKLRYEVSFDSGYSTKYAPLTVLTQYPKALSKVKENRKVYITLNSNKAPLVRMPEILNGSVPFAKAQLESRGLKMGKLDYKPHVAEGRVLEQSFNGSEIAVGLEIPQGSTIDLVVGKGYGSSLFRVPDVTGYPFDEAEQVILGSKLLVGLTISVKAEVDSLKPGTILRQRPEASEEVRAGEEIDLWVIELDSALLINDESGAGI